MTGATKHSLRGLLIAQFCGAFNDNAWKLIVAFLAIRQVARQVGASGPEFENAAQTAATHAFVAMTLPLMVVSIFAGLVADRVSKRSVIVAMKAVEVLLMVGATGVLLVSPSGGPLALVVLALMGAHSALFSPAKYGILPEILPHEKLSVGNSHLELWTFLAIIGGTVTGGLILHLAGPSPWIAGLVLTLVALAGLFASLTVPRVPPARGEGGLGATLIEAWRAIRSDQVLGMAVLGLVFFWTVASLVGQDALVYVKASLGLSEAVSGLPLAVLAIGVGAGAVIAGKLSGQKVEYGLIPLGAIGLALLLLLFGTMSPGLKGTLVFMAMLGVASGFLIVPINALIQWRTSDERRGSVIAFANIFVFSGILLGSLGADGLSRFELSPSQILIAAAVLTAGGTAWALWLLPDALFRLLLVLLTHTFYRLNVIGRNHVPEVGGVLLVPNHVSFVDGLALIASLDRSIRFVVEAAYFNHPLLKPFMKAMGAIPIAASGGPRVVLKALRDAGRYLDNGEVVCIFPEGQITRTGMLLPFRRGFERIVKGRTTPIVPVHLDRLWGSIFSFAGGRFITKWPTRIPYPVTVSFGAPLRAGAPIHEVRQAVQDLDQASWEVRRTHRPPLHHSFIRFSRRRPFRLAFADVTRSRVMRVQALIGAVALARKLRPHWQDQEFVGILLPPSVAGALANLAATLSGHGSVNLNYTAGRAGLTSAAKQAGLKTILTNRMFLEKAKIELPEGVQPLWIEDLAGSMGWGERLSDMLLALVGPIRLVERACGAVRSPSPEDVATIIFSSGSTGEPKGVMLTHLNIDANVEAVAQVFSIRPDDRMIGVLPFFHSFGYTATLWLGANHGLGVVYHPSPLDASAIGELVHRYRATFLIATPTFLQLYLRRCTPEQFGSLRAVLAGAEKLSDRLAQAFEERFGIRPLEGYGATECAPVIAVSVPDFRAPGFFQPGSRRGSVGQPLPGVSVRVVDPDTFDPLPSDTPGMLLVKGTNVMRGYVGRDDLTQKVMRDGWYVTGDIAVLDHEGFIRITDRLSRFSKIGGEMVPHGRVEEVLQEAQGAEIQVFAVTAVPDERKGERLAVLHTVEDETISGILEKLASSGLPNLFIPRRDCFLKVDKLPVLGTGKLDLREIKRIALERLQATSG